MKCVAEIMMIKNEAERERKAEEERLNQIAHEKREQNILKTIEYCETTINDFFVASAKRGEENPKFEIRGAIYEDRNNFEYFCPLKEVKSKYVNLRTEHRPDREMQFDFVTLIEYLSQFCYTIEIIEDSYWRFGWGCLAAKKIIISLM